jgi:hypothetical protein
MKYVLALAACCALVSVPFALASEGDSSSTVPCTSIKQIYSEKNWHEAKPARGQNVCAAANRGGARNTIRHFYEYREYRQITPYRCLRGSEGTFAIPCSIISCESHFSWDAANPSGAVGPYQLLGWGAPYPARTFAQRLANHQIAARVYAGGAGRSNWVC